MTDIDEGSDVAMVTSEDQKESELQVEYHKKDSQERREREWGARSLSAHRCCGHIYQPC